MSISYIKIIKEIMGKEAQKRGYKISSHPKLIATKPLAYFNREKNGYNQSFEITEYLIGEKTLFLRCCGKEIHLKYQSVDEFRDCIILFNEYMLNEGYELIENSLSRPVFSQKDSEYVLKNYNKVFDDFQYEFEGKSVNECLRFIDNLIQKTYKLDFSLAKELLLNISCILTGYLLNINKKIYIVEGTTTDKFYLERIENLKRKAHEDPCNIIITSYRNKDTQKWFYNLVKKFFNEDELD